MTPDEPVQTPVEVESPDLSPQANAAVSESVREVREFAGAEGAGPAGQVVGPGETDKTARPWEDAGRADLEQATAWTPTSEASGSAPSPGAADAEPAPSYMPLAVYVSLLVVAIAIPLVAGSDLWVVPLVAGPLIVLALVYQLRVMARARRACDG